MSRSGGRGRGWLNVYKNNPTPSPPGIVQEVNVTNSKQLNAPVDNINYADVGEEYSSIINNIKQLSVNDDGIRFNQKIKLIIETWRENCTNGEDVKKSFESVHNACLQDSDIASKTVLMISSRTFITQEVHDQKIRLLFLKKLQDNYENCQKLQATNQQLFRNSVQMLGEFYNKARLADGQQFLFMAPALMTYLEMLLESASVADFKLLTIQLQLNGASLRIELPEKITEMAANLRNLLISDNNISRDSKLWILLALEVINNRFALLPPEAHSFYQKMLGDVAVANFQGSHGTLSVQTTHVSKSLDSYQSNVNVLQVLPTIEVPNTEQIISPMSNVDLNASNYNTTCFTPDASQNSLNKKEQINNANKPGGRPILGAGARFNKYKGNDDVNWREPNKDSNAGTWNNKKGWSDNKRGQNTPKSNKGWEHDDRFETDYS